MLAILQINGATYCPTWDGIAQRHGFDTIWLDTRSDAPNIDITIMQPQLVLIQCYVQWMDFVKIGWDTIKCPIIASCGDARSITDTTTVFGNLPYLAKLHVEGMDYIEEYEKQGGKERYKLHYQHLCNDRFFPFITGEKVHDWCFIGQQYPAYDARLQHYRSQLVPVLAAEFPNHIIAGDGWELPTAKPYIPQYEVNAEYAKCHAVVSIDAHNGTGYTSTRTIEAMHGGHCVLVYDHDGTHYLKHDLKDGEHAFYFKTIEEFREKLQYIKDYPEFANRIRMEAASKIRKLGWTMKGWMKSAANYVSPIA